MKKFNVKALSLAVAAAVVSGAAAAEEVNFAQAVTEKNQGKAAFFTVFGEGTTFDKDTGKLTFKKDSDALLLKTLELEQTINGFASGSNFITTDANGKKTVRKATNEDIEADSLKGVGLAGGLTAVNARVDDLLDDTEAALDEQDKTIEELKTAITTNGTRIAEVATGVNDLNKSVADMGKDISDQFDEIGEEVTAVNTRVDSLAQDTADAKAAAKAAEDKVTALSANVDSKVTEAKDAAKAAEDKVTALSANIDSKVKEAKDAAANAVDAASKIDAVAEKADKANKAVDELAERAALSIAENAQQIDGFKEGDEIVFTDDKGIKSIKTADKADVEADEFQGLGLKQAVKNTQKATAQATLAAIENDQELNGFKEGDQIVVTKEDGSKVIRTAKKEDVEADGFGGKGLKEVVAAHDEALGDLTETVNDNSEALVKTAEVVNAISADVTANKEAIKNKADQTAVESVKTIAVQAKESVQAVQGAVEAAQKSAKDAENHAKDAQTSADTANNVASAAQTAAAQAQDAVKANATQVAANKADIVTLQTASNQHAAGIAKNSARIDSLDKNVANLRKETRQGLAAQAALSGLFQPYSVGKFNVTAALGGFKSDTAVAVGAGYRFNENFAAKAGLAVGTSSGSSASYNVGVNYEW